jgi:HMG-box domain
MQPKRPLSAYNFFFKEEREKILKIVLAEEPDKVENDPESEDYINDELLARLKKDGGKVSFEEMGKLIGTRWKNIDPDRLVKFSELAADDTERYKKEMVDYNGRQEAKMRSEALKPPVSFAARGEVKGGGADPRQVYPGDPMGGFQPGMPGGYPYGMDFSGGYAMPMGMYGYGGYPMAGGQGNAEAMARMGGQMPPEAAAQYGGGMYGMMGGGFQGGMMGYG